MRIALALLSLVLLSSCAYEESIFGWGGVNPKVTEEKEAAAAVFGVHGQVVTLTYKLLKTEQNDKCILCGNKTTLYAQDIKLNSIEVLKSSVPICNRELCLHLWVEKYVGFDVDKVKKK